MPNHPLFRFFLAMLLLSALTACSSVIPLKPDRTSQPVVVASGWQETLPAQSVVAEGTVSTQLLDLIDDPALTALVQQTLTTNLDLQQTALRLREQQWLTRSTNAATGPQLDLNLNSQRSQNSTTTSNHQLSLDLSWELDVWGRLADQTDAARAETDAQQLDYSAAANSLAARTIQGWLDIVLRDQMIRVEKQWLRSLEDNEAVIQERYRSGLSGSNALADLETARSNTALTRASLAARQQTQRDAYRQLAQLQGQSAPLVMVLPEQAPEIANPPAVLPADVVVRRPDLQAALQRIDAADAQARATHKQLLPGFSLSASLSQSRPQLDDLLSGSLAWNLLGQLTAPLFDGGKRKADAAIADLQAERSYLVYQQTLLSALNEVESALGQEASLAEQQRQLSAALRHAEASRQHYEARYRDGLNDILDLLSAQQSAFSTRIQLLQTQQARLTNRITLGLALGMGV